MIARRPHSLDHNGQTLESRIGYPTQGSDPAGPSVDHCPVGLPDLVSTEDGGEAKSELTSQRSRGPLPSPSQLTAWGKPARIKSESFR